MNYKHGLSCHPLYHVWKCMNARCYKPNHISYHNYGGRGIAVCAEWKNDPTLFIEWALKNGYKKGLTVDRKNNDGPYAPLNCRFITYKEQNINKRPQSHGPNKQRWFHAYGSNNEMAISNNQHELARKHGLCNCNISLCLSGKQKTHKGWIFRFLMPKL